MTRNSAVEGKEFDRYAVYRLLFLSFEMDVRSGGMKFDNLLQVKKVAANICKSFIRLSSLDLKLSANGEMWKRQPERKKKLVRPLSVFRERKVEKGVCPVCGKRFTVDKREGEGQRYTVQWSAGLWLLGKKTVQREIVFIAARNSGHTGRSL